ncbi:MAG TPA: hypothetical protein PKA64_10490 [Myxococcota bacterium]|nr:hypothetical protein [Myxococcota bacterium]
MHWIALALALTACDGGGDADDKATDTPQDDTDTTGTSDSAPIDDTDVPYDGELNLTGAIRDGAGAIITEGARVQYCRGTACVSAHDFRAGTYRFFDLDAGVGSFEVVNTSADARRPSVFVPITVDASTRTVDVVVPDLGPDRALGPARAWLDLGDGLSIEAGADDVTPASPFDPAVTAIAAARVTDDALPIEGLEGTLIAMFYLAPFDAEAEAGLSVRFAPGDLPGPALASGEAELFYADYADSTWKRLGDLTDDGLGNLAPAAALPKLSTLVILRKPM